MIKPRLDLRSERGVALAYTAVVLAGMLVFTGLAVDTGRAYIVKAQLSKAVDGAALAAARNLNSGDPRTEAIRVFRANFPAGFMGTSSSTDPTSDPSFFSMATDASTGVNTVTVNASAVLPTTFMRIGRFDNVRVSSLGQATRRMVDLSIVLDVSSSIGSKWGAVRDATRAFISSFDAAHDRVALLTFGNGAAVLDPMPQSRGFDKSRVVSDVPNTLPGGSTNMVEGLYRAWDELRSVPNGQQSGLRVIVLFTDGASNSVPASYDVSPGGKALRTYDFPKNSPDPDNQTWNNPTIAGLYDTSSGNASPSYSLQVPTWSNTCAVSGSCLAQVPYLPLTSYHAHHRSSGIPTSFPLQTNALTVDGSAQSSVRGLRNINGSTGRYPADVWNINNAARNLVEIIADAARNDAAGDYKIRIYTIGMGELVRYNLGTRREKSEDILKRMANDKTSRDFNANQLEGRYFYAQTEADVSPAFQGIQNQILRLSK
jgi:Flp pilus assembly protein TadG